MDPEQLPTKEHPGYDIREVRIRRGWSKSKLAKELGCSVAAVSRWESGERTHVTPHLAQRLCWIFPRELSYYSLTGAPRLSSLPVIDPNELLPPTKESGSMLMGKVRILDFRTKEGRDVALVVFKGGPYKFGVAWRHQEIRVLTGELSTPDGRTWKATMDTLVLEKGDNIEFTADEGTSFIWYDY
jgi:transcriptional regulator with XRE-family HTH domain